MAEQLQKSVKFVSSVSIGYSINFEKAIVPSGK